VVPRETIAALLLRNWLSGDSQEICGGDAKNFWSVADREGGVEPLNVPPNYTLQNRTSKNGTVVWRDFAGHGSRVERLGMRGGFDRGLEVGAFLTPYLSSD
jgi:hypothetical protein